MSFSFRRRSYLVFVFVILACAPVIVLAWPQAKSDDSLSAVAAELRLLRLSVEGSMRSQTDMNAMGVLLATVQSRVTQLTSRLDKVRDDVRVAAAKAEEAANAVVSGQSALGRE